jgi:CRISPR/Cas system CSM-associated protein Csm2 small subunit
MNDDIFSFDNFKRWIKDQKEFDPKIKKKFPIGEQVESKVSSKKFANVMTLEDGQMNRVVKDFMKNGGKIKEVSGKEFLIEVTMGSFYIAKNYVRRG